MSEPDRDRPATFDDLTSLARRVEALERGLARVSSVTSRFEPIGPRKRPWTTRDSAQSPPNPEALARLQELVAKLPDSDPIKTAMAQPPKQTRNAVAALLDCLVDDDEQTRDEAEEELRAHGIDVAAFLARVRERQFRARVTPAQAEPSHDHGLDPCHNCDSKPAAPEPGKWECSEKTAEALSVAYAEAVTRGNRAHAMQRAITAVIGPEIDALRAELATANRERDEARRTALAANVVGPWAWMPGGENDLDSMSEDMAVTMSAGTLRTLLSQAREPAAPVAGKEEGQGSYERWRVYWIREDVTAPHPLWAELPLKQRAAWAAVERVLRGGGA